ncbi:synaptotagmin-C-like [Callorhinchus milii]|uniref:synaptotagmin-C-like n=1 Tax=Callorhinchus milii TaxID=7868 RepID=UPI001C3FE992|nr:synaptotagmin-C-like [Callorhinchus milii]
MSGDGDDGELCRNALALVTELCFTGRANKHNEKCVEFSYLLRGRGSAHHIETDISVSLLSVIVTFCGIVLLSVSLFVSWKLCWIPWRDKGLNPQRKDSHHQHVHHHSHHFTDLTVERVECGPEMPERSYLDLESYPDSSIKLSQTSPDLPVDNNSGSKNCIPNAHSHQQVSALAPATRFNSLPRPVPQQLPSPDTGNQAEEKVEQVTSIGQIKPELYKQRSADSESKKHQKTSCGRINFLLRYTYASEQLVVKILKALDLPAKDANGFSDPYVKIYLLPDRKRKFQTKVHRKTLNPVFNETFQFNVTFNELPSRKLHFSVYDFDRFSRHDLIGQVVLDNLLEFSDLSEDTHVWRDILEGKSLKERVTQNSLHIAAVPRQWLTAGTVV